jgi:hypothetical protein
VLHLHDASWHSAAVLLGVGVLTLGLFVRHESRSAKPLLQMGLLRSRPLRRGACG